MLTLYVMPGCGYCAKVLRVGQELNLTFQEKNIYTPGISEELTKRGGKAQVPYLVDENSHIEMYESEDIIKYLQEHFKTESSVMAYGNSL